ncbi:UNVERIFIED_CONTAM: Retrovirus-related Pol polyprotein from transposon.6 [Sesamum calycinum]|uniref:Retrovirus-related Pol polyprotein from transposon.6 n=1 Tax=Sesamum calycinum TaxID=2727403 RepID=A0AAW2RSK4_9LAMI
MANSNKENHGSYKGESSLPTVFGPIVPPVDLTLVDANIRVQIQHQDRSTLADFASKEAAEHQPPSIWKSLKKKMVELHQQVMKETIHVERGIPFSEHIIAKELPAQFRALSHLPAYDGTTGLAEYIREPMDGDIRRARCAYARATKTVMEQNVDIFAWTASNLVGIDPNIVVHNLNLDPTFSPVKQKKWHFGPKNDIIQEKVRGTYCYVVMPFELKNVGVTYQHLVDRMFREQFRRNMEVYVDDMLVKSRQMDQHLAGLTEMFDTLRKYHMKLNPAKCAFGLQSGKFLKYMVMEKGIEVNPKKILAIQEMKPPANLNEVQRLEGCITTPGLPLLTKPTPRELLYLYLEVGQQAVSFVLLKRRADTKNPSIMAISAHCPLSQWGIDIVGSFSNCTMTM